MAELTGRALIASRCAKFFKNGDFVNLGIGVPLMCVNYLPEGVELWLEAEIGTVGSGPSPSWDDVDIDCIDAGGQPASIIPGGSVYDNETSFMFIRGGHIDAAVLGTLQVDQEGSIANWTIPGCHLPSQVSLYQIRPFLRFLRFPFVSPLFKTFPPTSLISKMAGCLLFDFQ